MPQVPNKIKYTSGLTTSDTIKVKNFGIGMVDGGQYGPTSQTKFWMGISPPISGYTIYGNKEILGPVIYVAQNDSELVEYAKKIISPSITTATQALTQFNTNVTDTICVNRDYDNVITSGMVCCIDAEYTPSYPRSGSTWVNLTYSGSNATLINTPTYNTGYINFSKSSSQYATIPNIGTIQNWTVEVWVRFTSSLTGQVSMVAGNQFNLSTSINFTIGTNSAPSSYNIVAGFFQSGWYNTTGFTPDLNTWYQIVGTYDGSTIRQYVNGNASGGTLNVSATLQSGGEVRLMRRWDDVVSSGNLIDGDLSIVRIYNRALSASEILSNYNAQSSRYIPVVQSFTTTGTTTWTAPVGVSSVEYLVVGGGGGGGNAYDNSAGGGGGAGMVLTGITSVVPGQSYTVTVGGGGAGGAGAYPGSYNGSSGGTSVFSTITAIGGGAGWGTRQSQSTIGAAQVGSTTAPTGGGGGGGGTGGKGGGGATGAGGTNSGATGGTGGSGLSSSISGSATTYGVGGSSANSGSANGSANGTANSGNGGQAAGAPSGSGRNGGNGGSGIVILKYTRK